ncbi:hypothetical protein [Parvularcula maris]|uniref:Uncharacterized protein n=1 Tax=Parvularcula maris TaxID=2965077 RepID=A0A9X2LCW9_9PROT|nr:hypothetical protein [Parvularcula maris]MCQ8186217.1 hypothetical protein [Parvularcula maris]
MADNEAASPRKVAYEPAAKAAAATRRMVEACGRHPFATGLFALLGIFGLVFSFYTYGVDRQESAEGTKQIEALDAAIEEVRQEVARQDPGRRDAGLADPLIIEVRDVIDNVTFQAAEESLARLELSADDATSWMERIEAEERHFSSTPDLWFTLRSPADRNFVQLAPYLLIDVQQVSRLAPDKLAAIFDGGRGAEGAVREFDGVLLPQEGLQAAPLMDGEGGYAGADYLTLSPGEMEEAFLTLGFVPGYVYRFRIGVQWRFDGRDGVSWLPGSYLRGVPAEPLPVYDYTSSRFVRRMHPDAMSDGGPVRAETLRERSAAHAEQVAGAKVFTPPSPSER